MFGVGTDCSAEEYCQWSFYKIDQKYPGEPCCKESENPSIVALPVPSMIISAMPSTFPIAYPF